MPEYVLDTSLAGKTWHSLDRFTQAYIETAMWLLTDTWYECTYEDCRNNDQHRVFQTCPDCNRTMEELTDDCGTFGVHDIADEAITSVKEDCARFQETYGSTLEFVGTPEQNGHDYFLTRNGHGAGFWDRGYPKIIADALTAAAKHEGSDNWYVGDDGRVYRS